MFLSLAAAHTHLRPGDASALAMYCQAVTKTYALAKRNDLDTVKAWNLASRNAAMWSVKLRISVQSQVLPDAAGRKRMNNGNAGLTVMEKFLRDHGE